MAREGEKPCDAREGKVRMERGIQEFFGKHIFRATYERPEPSGRNKGFSTGAQVAGFCILFAVKVCAGMGARSSHPRFLRRSYLRARNRVAGRAMQCVSVFSNSARVTHVTVNEKAFPIKYFQCNDIHALFVYDN